MIALFFDTETTGIKTPKDPAFIPRLVQLGCILQDLDSGKVLAEINLIANQYPLSVIPQGAIDVHGITNEMARDYGVDPKLIDVNFRALLAKADVVVAHNIGYDEDVVNDNLPLSAKVMAGRPQFCTMLNNLYIIRAPLTAKQKQYYGVKHLKPDAPYKVPNLTETYMHYFGRKFDGAHDAMADIRASRDILLEMIKQEWYQILDGKIQPTDYLDELLAKEGAKQ